MPITPFPTRSILFAAAFMNKHRYQPEARFTMRPHLIRPSGNSMHYKKAPRLRLTAGGNVARWPFLPPELSPSGPRRQGFAAPRPNIGAPLTAAGRSAHRSDRKE